MIGKSFVKNKGRESTSALVFKALNNEILKILRICDSYNGRKEQVLKLCSDNDDVTRAMNGWIQWYLLQTMDVLWSLV
jgi:hypothetical protein